MPLIQQGSAVPAPGAAEGHTGLWLHQWAAELLQGGQGAVARAVLLEAHEGQVCGAVQTPAEPQWL